MEPDARSLPRHRYDLFDQGLAVARLEWRAETRAEVGWYVARPEGPIVRLQVDRAIDDLAHDERSDETSWCRDAELAAILSTAPALDAAERLLHGRPERPTGRFRRLSSRHRLELYVSDVEPGVLLHAVPELTLEAVSDVTVLAGELLSEAYVVVARRIALLGGRVIATFRDDIET